MAHPKIERLFTNIDRMAKVDDLAAIIVHLNDTYLIESGPSPFPGLPPLPGMARIATLIDEVRARVRERIGDDRTLVLHSGDFMMPSRLGVNGNGLPMTRMLARFVDFAALGNHEFDLGAEALASCIRGKENGARDNGSDRLRVVCTNVTFREPRLEGLGLEKVALWPSEEEPLFAILGVMGKDTAPNDAVRSDIQQAITSVLESGGDKGAHRLIVLSHDDHANDLSLLDWLNQPWDEGPQFAYLLGGHDHHVNWSQLRSGGPEGRAIFSKCLSNGRSLRFFLVSRSQLIVDQLRRLTPCWDDRRKVLVLERLSRSAHLGRAAARVHDCVAEASRWADLERAFEGLQLGCDVAIRLQGDALSAVGATRGHVDFAGALAPKRDPPETLISPRKRLIDITDKSTRSRHTAFGKFVAQCILDGMKADIAVLHAGTIRGDDYFGPDLDTHVLEDVFIYDGKPTKWRPASEREERAINSIIRIRMTCDQLRTVLEHGRRCKESGGYLQRSLSEEDEPEFLRKQESFDVAIPSFLLCSAKDLDKYRAALADRPGAAELVPAIESAIAGARSIRSLVLEHCKKNASILDSDNEVAVDEAAEEVAKSITEVSTHIVEWVNEKRPPSVYTAIRDAMLQASEYNHVAWNESLDYAVVGGKVDPALVERCEVLKTWWPLTLRWLLAREAPIAETVAAARGLLKRKTEVVGDILEAVWFTVNHERQGR